MVSIDIISWPARLPTTTWERSLLAPHCSKLDPKSSYNQGKVSLYDNSGVTKVDNYCFDTAHSVSSPRECSHIGRASSSTSPLWTACQLPLRRLKSSPLSPTTSHRSRFASRAASFQPLHGSVPLNDSGPSWETYSLPYSRGPPTAVNAAHEQLCSYALSR
jgi:hypothetical protein